MYITDTFISTSKKYINQAKNILILAHKNPDGDAIGSGLALYHFFKDRNVNVTFVLPNEMPDFLSWMPDADKIVTYTSAKEKTLTTIKECDLIFMLDFNQYSRIDSIQEEVKNADVPKIMIDHHPNPFKMFTIHYTRTSSSSTAELMFEFFAKIEDEDCITKEMAVCLFVGIMTDTGCFNYNSSNPFTFRVIADLLAKEIDKSQIINKVYNNYSESRLRLLGLSINQKMKFLPEYHTAYIYLTKQELEQYNFEQGDTEGFVNYPLSIGGCVFSVIFLEKDGYTKCSFRSIGQFPANEMARLHFNGGGHLNAAGGEFRGAAINAIKKFEKLLPQYYEDNKHLATM